MYACIENIVNTENQICQITESEKMKNKHLYSIPSNSNRKST